MADRRAPHHTALSAAIGTEELTHIAEMIGVELLVIDANTTIRQFAKELRWNQAYHRLAQGLRPADDERATETVGRRRCHVSPMTRP